MNWIGITRALALSGCTDFSFCDEEALWRGCEVHKMIELADRGTLDRKTVPEGLAGYLAAHDKFMRETSFIPTHIEFQVKSPALGIRGRIDRAGLMRGKPTIVDFKTGDLNPAVALQLVLGGHLHDPKKWFHRCGVQLKANGSYSVKPYYLKSWGSDLATALAACRISRWKMQQGLV